MYEEELCKAINFQRKMELIDITKKTGTAETLEEAKIECSIQEKVNAVNLVTPEGLLPLLPLENASGKNTNFCELDHLHSPNLGHIFHSKG